MQSDKRESRKSLTVLFAVVLFLFGFLIALLYLLCPHTDLTGLALGVELQLFGLLLIVLEKK